MIGIAMPAFDAAPCWRERGTQQISDYYPEVGAYPDSSYKENFYACVADTSFFGFEALKLTRGNCLSSLQFLVHADRDVGGHYKRETVKFVFGSDTRH